LQQIAGWQTALTKLPEWARHDGIIYPPHLAMEQCSSEQTARYKAGVVAQLLGEKARDGVFYDLTGGFGVDFSYIAPLFRKAVYVEQQENLVEVARHNFKTLSLDNDEACCGNAVDMLRSIGHATMIFLDPARRDNNGGRTYALSDCTPDILTMKDELFSKADFLMLKLSPMLDWRAVVQQLGSVKELHIVSVKNECKELLVVAAPLLSPQRGEDVSPQVEDNALTVFCVNDEQQFVFTPLSPKTVTKVISSPFGGDKRGALLVPNSSIMKAGCFAELAHHYDVSPISANSHLFVSPHFIDDFPGRQFEIVAISSMNKRELRTTFAGISQANVAVRNFPMSAEQLRQRLRLRDGGDNYVFATTEEDGQHIIFLCKKHG
ncbi:MAG: SAM-dependent methyltransferase, partial [Prevotella sp.]|nr:SAM-dependent methyltransferase [Prevotella sp.]